MTDNGCSKRDMVIKEILQTEKSYLQGLAVTEMVFKIPLSQNKIMDEATIIEQFGGLTSILEKQKKFYLKLCKAEFNSIGATLLAFSRELYVYEHYLVNFDVALNKRTALLEHNKQFVAFLDEAKGNPMCVGLGLESYLIAPVQRVPRYKLLFEQLKKYTPEDHPDFKSISDALTNVSEWASKHNEAIRRREIKDQILNIMMQFDTKCRINLLDNDLRSIVRVGVLGKQCRRGVKDFMFWIFSDKMLYGERHPTSNVYMTSRAIDLIQCRVSLPAKIANQEKAFLIESSSKSFIVWAQSTEERDGWFNDMCKAMDKERARTNASAANIAPIWTPDNEMMTCEVCSTSFNVLVRRHHCRNCGAIVCDNCSKKRFLVAHIDPVNVSRVCDPCHFDLTGGIIALAPPTTRTVEDVIVDNPLKRRTSAVTVPPPVPRSDSPVKTTAKPVAAVDMKTGVLRPISHRNLPMRGQKSMLVHGLSSNKLSDLSEDYDDSISKREVIIDQTIKAELIYNNKLANLEKIFINPLKGKSNVLSEESFSIQFLNVMAIIESQKVFFDKLCKTNFDNIGAVFVHLTSDLPIYERYLLNFDFAMSKRAQILLSNKAFITYLSNAESNKDLEGCNLESFLLAPILRLATYQLFLEQLEDCTPHDHPDYSNILEANARIKDWCNRYNRSIAGRTLKSSMMAIMQQFDEKCRVDLINSDIALIREGVLLKQCRFGCKNFHFWLFSNMLLYGEQTVPGVGRYISSRRIDLNMLKIQSPKPNTSNLECAFVIDSPEKAFVAWASSPDEKDAWISEINRAIGSLTVK